MKNLLKFKVYDSFFLVEDIDNPFYNIVTVHFNKTVTLDGMLYAASSSTLGYGFPTEFDIHAFKSVKITAMATEGSGKKKSVKFKIK